MTVDCLIEDPRWDVLGLEALAVAASDATLRAQDMNPADWEISLLGCDDARITVLNTDFRDKPAATNVLSWPSDERGAEVAGDRPDPPEPGNPELGDIAIAYDTCAAEALAANKPLADHVTHLIVHATLHLLGYDHEDDSDAALMEGLETRILAQMGLDDPYRP